MNNSIILTLLLITSAIFLLGCTNLPVCGNNVCEMLENSTNCPADCELSDTNAECQGQQCDEVQGKLEIQFNQISDYEFYLDEYDSQLTLTEDNGDPTITNTLKDFTTTVTIPAPQGNYHLSQGSGDYAGECHLFVINPNNQSDLISLENYPINIISSETTNISLTCEIPMFVISPN